MVRMGLVGLGFMGQQHFAIHQGLGNVELVAVCDENPDKVAEVVPAVGGNIGDSTELGRREARGIAGRLSKIDLRREPYAQEHQRMVISCQYANEG